MRKSAEEKKNKTIRIAMLYYVVDSSFTLFQLIGSFPFSRRNAFALEKGLDPKKPLKADKGEGCALSITR